MDAQTIRRALADFFKFSPKDFVVSGNLNGYNVRLARVTAGGAAILPFPWKITIISPTTMGGNYTASCYPGTLSELLPSNIFTPFTLGTALTGNTYYIILTASTDGKRPTSCTLSSSTTAPSAPSVVSNAAPSTFTVLIGVIKEGTIYQIESTNLDYYPQVAFVETQTPAAPGDEAFVRWWRWARNDGASQS